MENMSFCGSSTGPYRQDYPAVVGGILESGIFATIIVRLEPAGLLFLTLLQAKVHWMPHVILNTLSPFITAKWDWLVVEYIRKTCCSFHHCQDSRGNKRSLTRTDEQPTAKHISTSTFQGYQT
jgi:hypothetical protein